MKFEEGKDYYPLNEKQVRRAQKIIETRYGKIFLDENNEWRFQFYQGRGKEILEKSLLGATTTLTLGYKEIVSAEINACLLEAGEEITI